MFGGVVGVLRIRLEGNLSGAKRAFDIESEDLDPIVIFTFDGLLPSVELLSFVDVFSACVASPRWKNQTFRKLIRKYS